MNQKENYMLRKYLTYKNPILIYLKNRVFYASWTIENEGLC